MTTMTPLVGLALAAPAVALALVIVAGIFSPRCARYAVKVVGAWRRPAK